MPTVSDDENKHIILPSDVMCSFAVERLTGASCDRFAIPAAQAPATLPATLRFGHQQIGAGLAARKVFNFTTARQREKFFKSESRGNGRTIFTFHTRAAARENF